MLPTTSTGLQTIPFDRTILCPLSDRAVQEATRERIWTTLAQTDGLPSAATRRSIGDIRAEASNNLEIDSGPSPHSPRRRPRRAETCILSLSWQRIGVAPKCDTQSNHINAPGTVGLRLSHVTSRGTQKAQAQARLIMVTRQCRPGVTATACLAESRPAPGLYLQIEDSLRSRY